MACFDPRAYSWRRKSQTYDKNMNNKLLLTSTLAALTLWQSARAERQIEGNAGLASSTNPISIVISAPNKKAVAADTVTISGTVSGNVQLVEYGANNQKGDARSNYRFRKVDWKSGASTWSIKVRNLSIGRTTIVVRAAGPWKPAGVNPITNQPVLKRDGEAVQQVTVIRKR